MALTQQDLTAALPDLAGSIRPLGLRSGAEVWRDPDGIPHIAAASAHDAFFVQGFVHAQDRLWHMEYDRRRGYGRWAEYAGPAGLAQDIYLRRLRLGATAREDYDAVNPSTRAMLEAYAAGVNAFLAAARTLPVEFQLLGARPEPWTPWDSIAVFKVRHVEMGPWQAKLWRARLLRHLGPDLTAKLCPGTQPTPTLIIPPGVPYRGPVPDGLEILTAGAPAIAEVGDWEGGSNSWALSGRRTASGKPLVAGDPHRALDVPGVYYQNHLACPDFDAIGLSFPGVPGLPHFGHNRFVAWCVTHAMADNQDLFIERFAPGDPGLYLFQGAWRRATGARETIRVRGAAPVEIDVTVTHHGPIALGDPRRGHAIAFRHSATGEANRTFEALQPMLRAASADDLEAAMRPWVDPVNNLVFADVHGTIGYRTRGQVPVRAAANAWLPVPGWGGAYEWQGVIPFHEMPAQRNPETGWIATANSRIAGPDYRHYLGLDFAPDFRTRRVIARLQPLERAAASDMAAIHADRVSIPARELVELLGHVVPTDAPARQALDRLLAWDGAVDRDGVAPTIYAALRERLMRDLLSPLLGPLAAEAFAAVPSGPGNHVARLKALLPEWIGRDDPTLLRPGDTWPVALSRALRGAVAELRETLGPDADAWRWGRVHVTRPRHPLSAAFPGDAPLLDPPSVAVSGDGDTVHAGGYVPASGYAVTLTSVARYVFDLGDWSRSAWIVPLGASGHPGSPYYTDQAPDWADARLRPMRYDWDRIRSEAECHQRLDPGEKA
ncbi:MAG TPA: penicillin acylase family protein [bacterium]|nr:penicillin acylase family protein [bacterium]